MRNTHDGTCAECRKISVLVLNCGANSMVSFRKTDSFLLGILVADRSVIISNVQLYLFNLFLILFFFSNLIFFYIFVLHFWYNFGFSNLFLDLIFRIFVVLGDHTVGDFNASLIPSYIDDVHILSHGSIG